MFNWIAAEFEDSDLARELGFVLCNTSKEFFYYLSATNATKVIVGLGYLDSKETITVTREDSKPTAEDISQMIRLISYFIFSDDSSNSENLDKVRNAFFSTEPSDKVLNGCIISASSEGFGGFSSSRTT